MFNDIVLKYSYFTNELTKKLNEDKTFVSDLLEKSSFNYLQIEMLLSLISKKVNIEEDNLNHFSRNLSVFYDNKINSNVLSSIANELKLTKPGVSSIVNKILVSVEEKFNFKENSVLEYKNENYYNELKTLIENDLSEKENITNKKFEKLIETDIAFLISLKKQYLIQKKAYLLISKMKENNESEVEVYSRDEIISKFGINYQIYNNLIYVLGLKKKNTNKEKNEIKKSFSKFAEEKIKKGESLESIVDSFNSEHEEYKSFNFTTLKTMLFEEYEVNSMFELKNKIIPEEKLNNVKRTKGTKQESLALEQEIIKTIEANFEKGSALDSSQIAEKCGTSKANVYRIIRKNHLKEKIARKKREIKQK